jgi:hypothetical protein
MGILPELWNPLLIGGRTRSESDSSRSRSVFLALFGWECVKDFLRFTTEKDSGFKLGSS